MHTENPLRMLRSGHLPMVKTRSRTATIPTASHSKAAERRSTPDCGEISKSDCNLNQLHLEEASKEIGKEEENPIPLPPRNRNKTILVQKPRHIRKHPLIIPASSIQRTLDKVAVSSPTNVGPNEGSAEPMYANDIHRIPKAEYDSALNFEAQIESNLNALDDIPDPDPHHVSCEDLLKFAKPSSRTRGHESDEVRIMFKVLGKDVTSSEQCLEALDKADWDVMRAIKIVRLRRAVAGVDLDCCTAALEANAWDVAKAAQWILQQDGEVTQV